MKRELEVLEDNLEAMVQPRLADALSQRKVRVLAMPCGLQYD